MNALERDGFAQVGDAITWKQTIVDGKVVEIPNDVRIIAIVPRSDRRKYLKSHPLTGKQSIVSGRNLLDDPARKGKFDPKMVYVFEQ